jgi:hypothetical protein
MGYESGNLNQGQFAVHIGYQAGENTWVDFQLVLDLMQHNLHKVILQLL